MMNTSSLSSVRSTPEHLLVRVHQEITLLEDSLQHIAQTKKQLNDHAQEVKTQIHSAISRQSESLRNREVWLLGQVEVIKQAKDDLLFQQQEEINQSLGALKNALDCFESTMNSGDQNVEQVLLETLDKLKSLTLHPCEPPHITFKVNAAALKGAIYEFGKVDSKGLPTQVAFADPKIPSQCLPSCFEEYGDDDHHVLYKTVEAVNRERMKDHCIQVKIPKLKEGTWLHKQTAGTSHHTKILDDLKVSENGLDGWLLKTEESSTSPKLKADASIRQWLHHIQEGEMEEDFEIVSPFNKSRTTSESESIEVVPVMPPQETVDKPSQFNYFQLVLSSPSTAWLLKPQSNVHVHEKDDGTEKSLASKLGTLLQSPDEVNSWLQKAVNTKNVNTVNSNYCYSECACLPNHIEIEDLEDIVCISNLNINGQSKTNESLKPWLKEQSKNTSLEDVCRANELCSSVHDCCCEPNCMQKGNTERDTWRSSFGCNSGNDSSMDCGEEDTDANVPSFLETMNMIISSPLAEWLTLGCKEDTEEMEDESFIKHMKNMPYDGGEWLQKESNSFCTRKNNGSFVNVMNNAIPDTGNIWLLKNDIKGKSKACESNSGYDEWLSKSMLREEKSMKIVETLKTVESWSHNQQWLKKNSPSIPGGVEWMVSRCIEG